VNLQDAQCNNKDNVWSVVRFLVRYWHDILESELQWQGRMQIIIC